MYLLFPVLLGTGIVLLLTGLLVVLVAANRGSKSGGAAEPSYGGAYPGAGGVGYDEWGVEDWATYSPSGVVRDRSRAGIVTGVVMGIVGLVVAMTGIVVPALGGGDSAPNAANAGLRGGSSSLVQEPGAGGQAGDEEGRAPVGRETVTVTAEAGAGATAGGSGSSGSGSAGAASSGGGGVVPGDLGLSVPMTRPSGDGRGIVVLASAVTPGNYENEISAALAANPGSLYLRTDQACPSLRQRDDYGNIIYAVYRPSGYSKAEVCADVARSPAGSYGRWLDTTSDPRQLIYC